jgi:hypothetical protein
MTRLWNKQPQLHRDEEQFVTRLAAHYAPTPLTPAQRAALDAALWTRFQRPPRWRLLAAALATVIVAGAVSWLALPGLFTPPTLREGGPGASGVKMPGTVQWEDELLSSRELTDPDERDESAMLPDDYRVIAQVFLEG